MNRKGGNKGGRQKTVKGFDPWEAASGARKTKARKKTLRLAGNGPDKVHTLIKRHAWRGRAIYVYHLVHKAVKRIDKPTVDEWDRFGQLGVPVAYPSPDHPSTDVEFWVSFGKQQAQRLGLQVRD